MAGAAAVVVAPARYRVLRGTVWHRGGQAGPGELIDLPADEGDPLCAGPDAVLARVAIAAPPEPAAPTLSVKSGVASMDAATDGPLPAPSRPRRAKPSKAAE